MGRLAELSQDALNAVAQAFTLASNITEAAGFC